MKSDEEISFEFRNNNFFNPDFHNIILNSLRPKQANKLQVSNK